ncbi:unnamed protein product [Gongylonema pulchrum]|uniref:Uncharacterized protein n=1 Tax=Gongylonema pulchrum TaxID=637853 RepID=A0A183E9V3_9BILA|nr:unnamed protein product [Gongylonema pulchrum]
MGGVGCLVSHLASERIKRRKPFYQDLLYPHLFGLRAAAHLLLAASQHQSRNIQSFRVYDGTFLSDSPWLRWDMCLLNY